MISDLQYQLIGKITIGFNELDSYVEIYAAHLLGTFEHAIAERVALRAGSFNERCNLLSTIVLVLGEQYPDIAHQTQLAEKAINRAREVAARRNQMAHAQESGHPVHHGQRTIVSRTKTLVETVWDEQQLHDLFTTVEQVRWDLLAACDDLFNMIVPRRTGPFPPR